MKQRILLHIEYRGTSYSGWQRQINAVSIQQTIEDALKLAVNEHLTIHGAGRTDKGVHALCQYAHFDTGSPIPPDNYRYILNNLLPPDIRIISSKAAPDDFHARFSALSKTYIYRLWAGISGSAVRHDTHCLLREMPDIPKMRQAAGILVGTHDFAAFVTKGSNPSSTVRTITDITISRQPEQGQELTISISGNSFLYNMVRVIVAQLLRVGYSKIDKKDLEHILAQKERQNAKESAPAGGLYLADINYPSEFGIPND